MLEFDSLNYWAVAVAWLISCAVGAFWYSPAAFGKKWKEHTGVDLLKIPVNEANKTIGFIALSAVFQVVTLAVMVRSLGAETATEGFTVGFVLWLGLTAATTVGVTLYSRRSWKFLWMNSGYFLLVMAVNSVILALWR